jgi:HAD superfamily hydrolase (TIGR01457 family)
MLPAYTAYLIDLDGVIYRGEQLLPGAKDFVAWLDTRQKKYLFLTNNSFASEMQVIEKLARLGITTNKSHILGAGQAAVRTIARRFAGARVYVVGEQALTDMVQAHHLTAVSADSREADVLLVGLDRDFNYKKLTNAAAVVRAGAHFIAINRDAALPIIGDLIPGCGAMVAAIEAASGITPEVIGKPQPALLQEAMQQLASRPDETIMIGDSLDIDIAGGKAAHTSTLLVLSGKDSRESLAKSRFKPDFVYENLAAMLTDV